jgi:hypothetical protein
MLVWARLQCVGVELHGLTAAGGGDRGRGLDHTLHLYSAGRNRPGVLRWQCMRMARRALATLDHSKCYLCTRAGPLCAAVLGVRVRGLGKGCTCAT